MRISKALRRVWLDLRVGACSGFPACCNAFFTLLWGPLVCSPERYGFESDSNPTQGKIRHWYHSWVYRTAGPDHHGYIPCPLCVISGARVQVRRCDEECGHREEADLLNRS